MLKWGFAANKDFENNGLVGVHGEKTAREKESER